MHRHPVTYTDFNDNQKSKELYFNLSEAELTKLQKDYLHEGGIQAVMNRAVVSGDTAQLLDFFELLVRRSYGIKSPDGEIFDKSEKIWNDFENSAFYSDLYMSFFQDEGRVGQAFIRAVMPADLINKAEANVRGEGELAAAAQAAQGFKPDARTIFEQSKDNLKDHMAKVEERNTQVETGTTNIFEQAAQQVQSAPAPIDVTPQPDQGQFVNHSERYEPQNQPQAPSFGGVPETPGIQSTEFRVPVQQESSDALHVDSNEGLTRAAYAQRQAELIADQQNVARPPHESGNGYQQ
jgi:hypothetical protein